MSHEYHMIAITHQSIHQHVNNCSGSNANKPACLTLILPAELPDLLCRLGLEKYQSCFEEEEVGLHAVIPYSGKFSRGPNFRDFRDPRPKRENKNREIRNRENLNT